MTIGPNLAAVLVGDLYFAIALLWPVRPDGQPGMFTIMVSWAGPWIVLAAIATWVELGGGGQPHGAILAILLLGYLGAFIPIVFLFGQHHTPQVFPREWLEVGEEAILVGVGVLFMAAGVGLHGRRDGRARTRLA